MRILVFDSEIEGHHLEYIDHIYRGCHRNTDNEYIFAIPEVDNTVKKDLILEDTFNIKFRYLSSSEINSLSGNIIHRCIFESILIKRICREQNCSEIILINLAPVTPVLPLLLRNNIKVRGIIYNLFTWKPTKGYRKLIDKIRYRVLAKNQSVERVFILNDKKSADILNKHYNSNKFVEIVDPIPDFKIYNSNSHNTTEIIQKHPVDEIMFLHFGAMDWRKGTIDILNAIELMPENPKLRFVFAGKISDGIKDDFYKKVDSLKDKFHITVIDRFCSYEQLQQLCELSDCILMPYHITAQSSGLLGYASRYHLPVIGPESGLIGYLISKFKLGLTLSSISGESLAKAISDFVPYSVSDDYAKKNTIEEFQISMLQ